MEVTLLLLLRPFETPVTVAATAIMWVACVSLNNHLAFEWSSLTDFRHLIFVPAGVKLALIMALGVRGALGIAVGTMAVLPSDIPALSLVQVLALSLAYAGAALAVVTALSCMTGLAIPWLGLRPWHLALFAVVVAIVTSATFNGLLAMWDVLDGAEILAASVAMVGGDLAGTGILFASILSARSALRRLRR